MSYEITKRLTLRNQSNQPLVNPVGVEIHSTDTPEATDENENSYFNNNNVGANAHAFVDYNSITQGVEVTMRAWGAGPTANSKYLMVELCEFADADKFTETWNRAVWLTAYWLQTVCHTTVVSDTTVPSHNDTSHWWRETDHEDPIEYFARHGKTMQDFRNDVAAILGQAASAPAQGNNMIATIQQMMNSMGFRDKYGRELEIDGISGANTVFAVRAFQSVMGLTVDGIVGPNTMLAITQIKGRPADSIPAPHYEYATRFICYKVGCTVSGTFDSRVASFVMAWQSKNKLTADGVVGPNTWAALLK